MEVREFVAICLILIAMVAIAVFIINIAWNLAKLIPSAVVIVIIIIGTAILVIGRIVDGIFSWIVLAIVNVIVYIKNKFRKDK